MSNEIVNLFGIDFNNLTMKESLEYISKLIDKNKNNGEYGTVVTPNVDHIVNVHKNRKFADIYKKANLKLVDGMPILLLSKLFNKPLKEKVSGADLTPLLFKMAYEKNYKIFIFGSLPNVSQKVVQLYKKKYGVNYKIDSYSPPFGFESNEEELKKSINVINEFKPDILLVALGSPKGEYFMFDNLNMIKVPLSIQIGASIDFIAGAVKRAPVWMQKCSLEWFYRFIKEPKRMFRRYFINDVYFICIILKEFENNLKRREEYEKK